MDQCNELLLRCIIAKLEFARSELLAGPHPRATCFVGFAYYSYGVYLNSLDVIDELIADARASLHNRNSPVESIEVKPSSPAGTPWGTRGGPLRGRGNTKRVSVLPSVPSYAESSSQAALRAPFIPLLRSRGLCREESIRS